MLEKAVILSTGDELTTGRTADTNASFIADRLVSVGIDVVAILVVGDYPDRMMWAWQEALKKADLVVCTGGLGPTADDLTTETVAKIVGRKLVRDEAVAQRIRQRFEAMGRAMPENNLKQADFPEEAVILPNPLGTAPGYRLAVETGNRVRHIIVMPGVPREMKPMLDNEVLPWIQAERGRKEIFLSHTFQTFGLSESALDQLVAGIVAPEEGRLAFRAAFPQISVRITVEALPEEARRRLDVLAARMRERLGEFCYGEGEVTMEGVVGALLRERGTTLAVAESCTGGLIGHRITNVPGSSAYLLVDIVAYSNAVKERILGVPPALLAQHGAVSVEVAEEMASAARRISGATLGLATTGIAGPEGGTPEKPVGTVCVALATPETIYSHRYQLWGTREWIKLLVSQIALDWIRRHCLGLDPTIPGILKQ